MMRVDHRSIFLLFMVIAVSRGSLLDHRRYGRETNGVLAESMLPLSIGVEVFGGDVEFCLPRGQFAPTERSRILAPHQLARLSTIRVVAGERVVVKNDITLGEWTPSSSWRSMLLAHETTHMVILRCSYSADEVLSVQMQVTRKDPFDDVVHAHSPVDIDVPLTLFESSVSKVMTAAHVEHHLFEADSQFESDTSRRQTQQGRASFERLVLALWHSLDSQEGQEEDEEGHRHRGIVPAAVQDAIALLIQTAGKQQAPLFWEHLEASLRKRVAFEEDHSERQQYSGSSSREGLATSSEDDYQDDF